MANPIKYTSTTQENSINTGNFAIGVNKGGYGPTNLTNFYNGKTPNIGGYTVYVSNSETASPSIFMANNDEGLITLSNQLGGSGITTITAALNFFNASTTMLCTNNMDYPNIVTDGLVLNLDAAFTPSYPKNGTTWKDLSGNGNNGTLVNGVSYDGGNGGNLSFDGVDDYVEFGNILNQGLNSFTITTWFVRKNNTSGWLLSKSFAGAAVGRYWLDINNNKIRVGIAWTSGHTNYFSNSNIENDLIYNVVAVINRIGNLQIYLNGLLDAEYNISSSSKVQLNTSFPFRIGSYTDGDQITPSYFFNGNIYQTSIYNRSLTPAEILQNYYAGLQRLIPTDGLVLSLDAQNTNRRISNPTIANDMSGNNYNGTMMNGTALSIDGGTSFSFDGTNDYISIGNDLLSTLTDDNSLTVSIFVNINESTLASRGGLLCNQRYLSETDPGGFGFVISDNGFIAVNLTKEIGGVKNSYEDISKFYMNREQYTLYTFTYNSITKTVITYKNGIQQVTSTNANYGWTKNTTNRPTNIGINSQGGWGAYYKMYIGDVRIYNRVLTQTEISTIYTATKSRYESLQRIINAFKSRLLVDIGIFEAESCLDAQLVELNDFNILDSTSLIITPNGYKENKLYSVMPNNSTGDSTVTRATTGTRVNSDGLIEDVPYNLVSYSEQFDNSAWSKGDDLGTRINVTTNQTISPDGSLTADLVVPTTDYREHAINPILSLSSLGINRIDLLNWSTYVKSAGNDFFILRTNLNNSWVSTIFNIENGTIVSTHPNFVSSNITNSGNGWYRISVVTENMTIYDSFQMISTPTGAITFSGDGISGVYMWGTQITRGEILKDYFPTTNRLNIPRIDYSGGGCPSILVEPQRSNYFINNSYSDKNNTTNNTWLFTRKPNQGIYGLDSIEGTAQGGYVSGQVELRYTPSLPAGSYTHTFYVKKNCDFNRVEHLGAVLYDAAGQSQQSISFNTTTGDISSNIGITIKNVSDKGDWWKISYVIYSSGGLCYFDYEPYYNTGGSFEICGSQIEFGIGSTSFIPTLTSVVTRNGDIIQSSLLNYNTTSYSIFFDIEYFENFSVGSGGSGDIWANIWYFRRLNSTSVNFWNQNAQQTLGSFTFSPANSIKRFKGCLVFNGSTISTFVNGTKVGNQITPTNLTPYTTFLNSNTNRIRTSKVNLIGTVDSSHKIKLIYIVPTSITDTEAINLTTI